MAPSRADRDLARLEALRHQFGPAPAREKRALASRLARVSFAAPDRLQRWHEALLYIRAIPDDAGLLRAAERALRRFATRADLRRHRAALADSGIAGTAIRYRFYAAQALRLATRHPGALRYDWADYDDPSALEPWLPLIAEHGETPALDELDLGVRGWLRRMTGGRGGDAAFFLRRLVRRLPDAEAFERVSDGIDAPMVLEPARGGPSRTAAHRATGPVHFQKRPLNAGRPDLAAALAQPPRAIRAVDRAEGTALIELAMDAMVTRARDLDAFANASPGDVRLIDCGEGLVFACFGAQPARRLQLESVYAFLTLRNGVPAGYVLLAGLYQSAEVAYNIFEPYRGGDAAWVYGRVLAAARALFGATRFVVPPYQLGGGGNAEGLRSGAWWFYRKLGFAPRDAGVKKLLRAEEVRMAVDPARRTPVRLLAHLSEAPLFWPPELHPALGALPLPRAGLAVTDLLARRFGGAADRGVDACEAKALTLLGGTTAGWNADEKLALRRWAPLVLALPGVRRWGAGERRALLAVIRAKGGRRESDFVRRFDAHPRLSAALARLVHARR